jgi:hypothetical protein
MKLLSLAFLAAAGYASAQGAASAAFTDPATGISFQAFTSGSGSKFGVALPKTGGGDLIGILVRTFSYAINLRLSVKQYIPRAAICREHC